VANRERAQGGNKSRDPAERPAGRHRLVLECLPHVIAHRWHEILQRGVGMDGLIYAGVLGIVSTAFDPVTGVAFETYASPEVRGAILDGFVAGHQEILGSAVRVLRSLPERDREVLVRFYLGEQPQEQICAELDLNSAQFRQIMTRVKARFGNLGGTSPSRRSQPGSKATRNLRSPAKTARFVVPEDIEGRRLDERDELLAKKYAAGLQPDEVVRLAEIDQLLERDEIKKAELIDAKDDERLARIDAGLDRVEKAIHDLQALNLR